MNRRYKILNEIVFKVTVTVLSRNTGLQMGGAVLPFFTVVSVMSTLTTVPSLEVSGV